MPVLKQIRTDRRKKESCWLLGHRADTTSQCGEDGVLAELFRTIGAGGRWCVEFGAWDGRKFSNTYNLIANAEWSGVLIEGSQAKFADLLDTYRDNPRAHCRCEIVSPLEGPGSLDEILKETPLPQAFDLLSIDIDGNDYHVWQTLTRYRPRVVIIEYNPTVPNDVIFIQDRDIGVNQGCSLLALVELGRAKGYQLAAVTPLNAIFVTGEEFEKLGIADNSIDAMAFSSCDAKYFDGYDGTLYHVGFDRLHWVKNAPLEHERLQVLPPERRSFADGITVTARQT